MTPYELGRQAHQKFGEDAENPFDFAKEGEYIKWKEFEEGWQAREKAQEIYEIGVDEEYGY
jgi:hypothetical protein